MRGPKNSQPRTAPENRSTDNGQLRTLISFENVQLFLEQHPTEPEPPLLAGMRKSLQASIVRISKHGATQRESSTLEAVTFSYP